MKCVRNPGFWQSVNYSNQEKMEGVDGGTICSRVLLFQSNIERAFTLVFGK